MSETGAHREKHFEDYIVGKLAAQGWLVGKSEDYDAVRAMVPGDLIAWLDATQPETKKKLVKHYPSDPVGALMDRIAKVLEKEGTVAALRKGVSVAGCGHIDLSEAAPEDERNEKMLARYKANILRVIPQLEYQAGRQLAIDLGFFINGLPVATVELKTDFTQSAEAAIEQYKTDRLPLDPKTKQREPLLTFKRGAVVHFAMSDSEIWMTTKLDGQNTVFLPFNQGNHEHAGNPPRSDGEYPVAYFWERVCQRDAWLRIFHSFVYVAKRDVADLAGNWSTKETLMFPRFHQWDAVNAMIADAKANGPGFQYLCEHSAGSGKTSTIAWTTHDLIRLRRPTGEAIFDSVIIVTDRRVLDAQLREAVAQIDHQFGTIAAIGGKKSAGPKSAELTHALAQGVPIIVVTIQTFPFALAAIVSEERLKDKHFAVIIDEAHNSQTGSDAARLRAALSLPKGEDVAALSIEELLTRLQQSRVLPKNVSHFAFTATPKHSTFMLFGRTKDGAAATKENLPQAFHRYPMRQAIEEGFILDVLAGYVPYKTAFHLAEAGVKAKRVSAGTARRRLARWMALHPTNVTQKVRFIIEHFAQNVMPLLDGKAKAMVVASSRAAAVRYKLGFDAFIATNPRYGAIRSLVAFSGTLTGAEVMHAEDERLVGDAFSVDEGAEFSEHTMNPGVVGDLAKAFDRPEYRVMLVADKFQTGFDQPKLVAMYIDKKIANDVEIVQTFSRVNRTAPGKDTTFIIDFVNEPQSVRAAFAKYDAGAEIEDVQDPNVVYEIKDALDAYGFYEEADLEAFKTARFETLGSATAASKPEHKALYAATERATRAYDARLKALQTALAAAEAAYEKERSAGKEAAMKAAEHAAGECSAEVGHVRAFGKQLARFVRTYRYIAQLLDLGDPELENFAAFAKLLEKRLGRVAPEEIDVRGLLLTGFSITSRNDEAAEGDATAPLHAVGPGGAGGRDDRATLDEIIERLNRFFGDAAPLAEQVGFTNGVANRVRNDKTVVAQVQHNGREQAMKGSLPGAVQRAVVSTVNSYEKLRNHVLKSDAEGLAPLYNVIYDLIREGRSIDYKDPRP